MAKKSTMSMVADALAPAKNKTQSAPADESKKEETEVVTTGEAGETPAAAASAPAAEPPKEDKKPAGPVKITTNAQLLKALWSSRGNVFFSTPQFPVPLAVVKKEMTQFLQNVAKADGPAPFDLVPRADNTGSDLIQRPEYVDFLAAEAAKNAE